MELEDLIALPTEQYGEALFRSTSLLYLPYFTYQALHTTLHSSYALAHAIDCMQCWLRLQDCSSVTSRTPYLQCRR